jgi:hypothetical protein
MRVVWMSLCILATYGASAARLQNGAETQSPGSSEQDPPGADELSHLIFRPQKMLKITRLRSQLGHASDRQLRSNQKKCQGWFSEDTRLGMVFDPSFEGRARYLGCTFGVTRELRRLRHWESQEKVKGLHSNTRQDKELHTHTLWCEECPVTRVSCVCFALVE